MERDLSMWLILCLVVRVIFRFADTEVRKVAVSWIESSSDDELADYLPQLVQVCAYTHTHTLMHVSFSSINFLL